MHPHQYKAHHNEARCTSGPRVGGRHSLTSSWKDGVCWCQTTAVVTEVTSSPVAVKMIFSAARNHASTRQTGEADKANVDATLLVPEAVATGEDNKEEELDFTTAEGKDKATHGSPLSSPALGLGLRKVGEGKKVHDACAALRHMQGTAGLVVIAQAMLRCPLVAMVALSG